MTFLFRFPAIPNGSFSFPFPDPDYCKSVLTGLPTLSITSLYDGCKTLQPAWSSTLITGHITTALQQLHLRLVGMLNNNRMKLLMQRRRYTGMLN